MSDIRISSVVNADAVGDIRLSMHEIRLYAGAVPTSPDEAISSQTLVASFPTTDLVGSYNDHPYGVYNPNQVYHHQSINFDYVDSTTAVGSGTVTFIRIVDDVGQAIMDIHPVAISPATVTAGDLIDLIPYDSAPFNNVVTVYVATK
jgi:hypothetical protein